MIRRSTREHFVRFLTLASFALFVNSFFPITPVKAALYETPVRAAIGPIFAITDPRAKLVPADPQPEPAPIIKRRLIMRVSAYSSTRDQTDKDPFTTASGLKVHDGTIAINCLPFGTKIRIPDKFGDKIFTVEDRMSAKWGCRRGDIWMPTREQAKQWGVRTVTIEIL